MLLRRTERGLYCELGDFFVDPWRPVERAVVTHAHADHARPGSKRYLAARRGERVFRRRLGTQAKIEFLGFGEEVTVGDVRVALFPAGHILGSAQVRIEHRGEVWVVSGDYKVAPDPTCAPFEPIRCDTFITESTFGLPIYRWPTQASVFRAVDEWWRRNQERDRTSLLLAYSLGKAQRILAGVDPSIGDIYTHGAVEKLTEDYRRSGIALPASRAVSSAAKGVRWGVHWSSPPRRSWARFGRGVSVAPRRALLRAGCDSAAVRRQRAVDRGFVLSDHADWDGLVQAIQGTGAERIWVTHGRGEPLARWLRERGLDAETLDTRFGETSDDETDTDSAGGGEESEEPAEPGRPT